MSIPLATTTISVWSVPQSGEAYQEEPTSLASATRTATGIRAVIGSSGSGVSGREQTRGGQQSQITLKLNCDPVALDYTNIVVDDVTGEQYAVQWALLRTGIDSRDHHTEAAITQVRGLVSSGG